jgi:hypothetical protein
MKLPLLIFFALIVSACGTTGTLTSRPCTSNVQCGATEYCATWTEDTNYFVKDRQFRYHTWRNGQCVQPAQ